MEYPTPKAYVHKLVKKQNRLVTGACMLSYPSLHEKKMWDSAAHKFVVSDDEKAAYSTDILVPKDDQSGTLELMKKIMQDIIDSDWGYDVFKSRPKIKELNLPMRDGDTMEGASESTEGCWVISLRNRFRKPDCIDLDEAPLDPAVDLHGGSVVRVTFDIIPYKTAMKGFSFRLGNVQKLAEGKNFGAGGGYSADFDFGSEAEDDAPFASAAKDEQVQGTDLWAGSDDNPPF